MPTLNVVDLSHHNTLDGADAFVKMKAAGVFGVIHKITEGSSVLDNQVNARYQPALDAGLLWGVYHFLHAGNVQAQVDHFLKETEPDDATLLALDHEDGGGASLHDAVEFLSLLEDTVGRKAVVYSGNRIKAQLAKPNVYLSTHRLWLAQYGPRAVCPPGWAKPWLWQFGQKGACPGVKDAVDHNFYDGSAEDLATEWAS